MLGLGDLESVPAPETQPWQQQQGQHAERGYFYDTVADADFSPAQQPPLDLAEEEDGPRADGHPSSRVVFMASEPQGIAALDDVKLKLKILLKLAAAVHAVPAVGRPRTLLGGQLGNSTTDSWGTYVESVPRLRHADECRCPPGRAATIALGSRFLDDLSAEQRLDLFVRSRPLCFLLYFLVFRMRPDWHVDDTLVRVGMTPEWQLVRSGHSKTQLWHSQQTAELVLRARRETPELRGAYNVLHARRGDFRHHCTSPERAVRAMASTDAAGTWLIMSNAESEWSEELATRARAAGLKLVMENDIGVLAPLKDNFLKYQALQCLYSRAVKRVATIKELQMFCQAHGQLPEQGTTHLCRATGPPERAVIKAVDEL